MLLQMFFQELRFFQKTCLKVATHMRYLAKTKSCRGLYCYSLNSGHIDTHMRHVPHICQVVLCQTFIHFDVQKIPTFLGMTNTEPNLLSFGQALSYTLLVICQIFTKCHISVAALIILIIIIIIIIIIYLAPNS